ncbi:MAG TPA: hypothetical protein PKW33_21695 [Anaerolineaceae bacterium]|nr:hypothetical protein [Anaerolineaceae bacterium]HPN54223.1 hypothetical protein [Anaerolineaceae bacterium]
MSQIDEHKVKALCTRKRKMLLYLAIGRHYFEKLSSEKLFYYLFALSSSIFCAMIGYCIRDMTHPELLLPIALGGGVSVNIILYRIAQYGTA